MADKDPGLLQSATGGVAGERGVLDTLGESVPMIEENASAFCLL